MASTVNNRRIYHSMTGINHGGASVTVFNIAMADGDSVAGSIDWKVLVIDQSAGPGPYTQMRTGTAEYSAKRLGGGCTQSVSSTSGTLVDDTPLAGGLTVVWTSFYLGGTLSIQIQVTDTVPTSPLVAAGYPYLDFVVEQRIISNVALA